MPAPEQDLTPDQKLEKKFHEDLEVLLKGAQPYGAAFRRLLLFLVSSPRFCQADSDTTVLDNDGHVDQPLTDRRQGRREVGILLRAAAQAAAPDAYMRALNEAVNAARQEAVAMMSDPQPTTDPR